jgi:hypothetical protein
MALVAAAARCGARSGAKKTARSLSSGADVLAGSGYVAIDVESSDSSQRTVISESASMILTIMNRFILIRPQKHTYFSIRAKFNFQFQFLSDDHVL